jgi:hypothetical protein
MSRLSYRGALKNLFFSNRARVMAKTPDEALAAARRFGFPISMKTVSPDIPSIEFNRLPEAIVEDEPGVKRTFLELADAVEKFGGFRLTGIVIKPMAPSGQGDSNSVDVQSNILYLIGRKFITFISNPKRGYRILLVRISVLLAHIRLRRIGCDEFFNDADGNVLPPEWFDLYNLYNLVRTRRPEVVVEFGAGCSMAIMARALAENQHGMLYSFEKDKSWTGVAQAYLREEDKEFCKIIFDKKFDAPLLKDRLHPEIPNVRANLLYIDDEGHGRPPDKRLLPCCDVLVMEAIAPDDFMIVVDGQAHTVNLLKKELRRKYRMVENTLHHYTIFELIEAHEPLGSPGPPIFGGNGRFLKVSILNG